MKATTRAILISGLLGAAVATNHSTVAPESTTATTVALGTVAAAPNGTNDATTVAPGATAATAATTVALGGANEATTVASGAATATTVSPTPAPGAATATTVAPTAAPGAATATTLPPGITTADPSGNGTDSGTAAPARATTVATVAPGMTTGAPGSATAAQSGNGTNSADTVAPTTAKTTKLTTATATTTMATATTAGGPSTTLQVHATVTGEVAMSVPDCCAWKNDANCEKIQGQAIANAAGGKVVAADVSAKCKCPSKTCRRRLSSEEIRRLAETAEIPYTISKPGLTTSEMTNISSTLQNTAPADFTKLVQLVATEIGSTIAYDQINVTGITSVTQSNDTAPTDGACHSMPGVPFAMLGAAAFFGSSVLQAV